MGGKTKRLASLALALVLLLALLPGGASAAGWSIASGRYGSNINWSLSSDGVLTISGKGDMSEDISAGIAPWHGYEGDILELVVSEGVTGICDNAFSDCYQLSTVSLPDTLESIGAYAFMSCALRKIRIPASVSSIDESAFFDTGIKNILVDEENSSFRSMEGVLYNRRGTTLILCPEGREGEFTVPDGVTSIRAKAFYCCRELTEVAIPSSVTTIGLQAFYECTKLEAILVSNSNSAYCSKDGVLFNKDATQLIACPGNYWDDVYSVPRSVRTIGSYAFASCIYLSEITIPDSVTSIGDLAFYGCTSLTSIDVDSDNTAYCSRSGVLFSKNRATLYLCPGKGLNEYAIPSGVKYIDDYAFHLCSQLNTISIPTSVTIIRYNAFLGCPLKDVYYGGSQSQWRAITVDDGNWTLTRNANLHVNSSEAGSDELKITTQPKSFQGALGSSVDFTVVASGNNLSYAWYVKSPDSSKFVKHSSTTAVCTLRLTEETSGTKLYCVITDDFDDKVQSNTVAMTAIFTAPLMVSAKASVNGITVAWYETLNATKYKVYRKSGSSDWVALADVTDTRYVDAAVKEGATYTYTVKAYNGSEWSNFDTKGVSAKAVAVFPAPTLKSASAGVNGITVTWNAVSGATKYKVYRKSGSGSWAGLADVTGTSYVDTSVTEGTAYTYTVKAYNGSIWSDFDTKGVSARAVAVFGAPVLKGASSADNGITVTWNAVSGATKYKVYRKSGSGSWVGLADVTTTSYVDASVTEGVTYTYTVKAWNGSKWSSFDTTGVSVRAVAVFGAPVLKGASASASGITVTWNAVSGATKYKVYRKTGSGGWVGLADVTGTAYVDASVTEGTAYTYTVKA